MFLSAASELSLQCIECHIIFSDHKSKRRHIKLSHPDVYERSILTNALFVCYVCERQFTNSTDLMAHQKGHVEKKPFHCPICSQAFKRSSELTLHKKVHLGKDGYVCMDCGKACKTLTLMKYHIRTHTGERPYVCAECGERFRFSKALQKHTLTHTPEGAEGNQGVTPTKVKLKKKDGKKKIYFWDMGILHNFTNEACVTMFFFPNYLQTPLQSSTLVLFARPLSRPAGHCYVT